MAGVWLVGAAGLFWLAWVLMPGVGVTDARQIFALVASQRSMVAVSVVLQLVSAVLYVPALMSVITYAARHRDATSRWGAGLLLVGAMGSAADAVLHLLAYAMTAPDVARGPMVPVMAFMQGPGLFLLAPMIASFFLGGGMLSWAFAKAGRVSRWNPRLHLLSIAVAVMGGALASFGMMSARAVGLTALGLISAAQAGIGLALWRGRSRRTSRSAAALIPSSQKPTQQPSSYALPENDRFVARFL